MRWSGCSSTARLFGERDARRSSPRATRRRCCCWRWPAGSPGLGGVVLSGAGAAGGAAGAAGGAAGHRRSGAVPAAVSRRTARPGWRWRWRSCSGGCERPAADVRRAHTLPDGRAAGAGDHPAPRDRDHADLAGDRGLAAEHNVEPPFWAFAWPGGQALARHVLDHPHASPAAACSTSPPAAASPRSPARWPARRRSRRPRSIRLARAAIALNAAANGVAGRRPPDGDVVGARLPLGPDPVRRRLLRGADDRAHPALAAPDGRARPRSGSPIPAAPTCRATGSTAFATLPRADQPGTGGPHRAAGHALPARLSDRLRPPCGFRPACRRRPAATGRGRSPSASGHRSRCPTPAACRPASPGRAA